MGAPNGTYKNGGDDSTNLTRPVVTISSHQNSIRDHRIYSYGEAIDLAGNGWYSIGLLLTLSMATLAMGIDMFGFSVVVTGCTCDFNLDIRQTSVLLSMPFIGPIVMAYPWGYISDTQGRRKSLLIAMWVSFVVSTISAFSPNWLLLAVLKFISTSFCAQSASYTLLGESSTERMRDAYMLIMTSVLDFSLAAYVGVAYFSLSLDFSYDLGFITFTPWRLLTLALALPLGLGALGIHFFYESPKFLVNAGKETEAVEILSKIWKRNGGKTFTYPVKRVFLDEVGNEKRKDASLMESLWEQIIPLFKPPLLYRSLQLYFFTAIIFSTNNSYFIWFPYLAEKFSSGLSLASNSSSEAGLCSLIVINATDSNVKCSSKIDLNLVWSSLAQGVTFVVIMMFITKFASRKRFLMIIIMLISGVSSVGAGLIRDNLTSFIMFIGMLLNELCIGIVYTYFVDLYPTSYRGMAACIGVMVARASALTGVNLLGAFIMSHCTTIFYICGGLMTVAALLSFLLPPDRIKS